MPQIILDDFFMALRCLLTSAMVFSLTYVLLPFRKATKKPLILTTVVITILCAAGIAILYHFTSSDPSLLAMIFVPLLLAVGTSLILIYFRDCLSYALFCFVLSMIVYLIVGFPTEALKNALSANSNLANSLYLLSRTLILGLLFPFFLLFLRPRILKVQAEIREQWTIPLVLSALVLLLIVFVGVFPTDWSKRDASNYYLIGYVGVFVIGFYVSIYLFIRGLLKQKHKELDQQAMNKKIEALEAKINQDERYQTIISKKEHDLRHHISALRGLLEKGQYPEALDYLREYDQQNAPLARPFHTGSFALDAILAMSFERCRDHHIAFECTLALPERFSLSENEIIALFSNALENAYHGALASKNEKPGITLLGKESKGFYTIILKNPAKPISFKNGMPLRDDSEMGIGTQNIVDIIHQHHGFCSFSYSEGVFILEAALPAFAPHD